jgi:hypothetical protein
LRRLAILLALISSLAPATAQMKQTLTLPSPLKAGASAWLVIEVGPLDPGQRVRVTTDSGELIGTVAPFGATERRNAGVYSFPVPPVEVRDGALRVLVTVTQSNAAPRTPSATEVRSVRLLTSDADK